jgi:hypothetical protein
VPRQLLHERLDESVGVRIILPLTSLSQLGSEDAGYKEVHLVAGICVLDLDQALGPGTGELVDARLIGDFPSGLGQYPLEWLQPLEETCSEQRLTHSGAASGSGSEELVELFDPLLEIRDLVGGKVHVHGSGVWGR